MFVNNVNIINVLHGKHKQEVLMNQVLYLLDVLIVIIHLNYNENKN